MAAAPFTSRVADGFGISPEFFLSSGCVACDRKKGRRRHVIQALAPVRQRAAFHEQGPSLQLAVDERMLTHRAPAGTLGAAGARCAARPRSSRTRRVLARRVVCLLSATSRREGPMTICVCGARVPNNRAVSCSQICFERWLQARRAARQRRTRAARRGYCR